MSAFFKKPKFYEYAMLEKRGGKKINFLGAGEER
jgi:hypothetical protein